MKTTLLIVCWVLTTGALIGCAGWLELRFNMFAWDPKPGLFSFLPYLVIVGLLTAAVIMPTAAESRPVVIAFLIIAAIPLIYGVLLLPEEKTVGKRRKEHKSELKLGPNPTFLAVVGAGAKSFHKSIENDPNWLKRHDGETSPFWFRFHRFVILAIPFLFAAWHLWQSRPSRA